MTEEIRSKQGVMAEEIRVVEHYSASILNKVEEGAPVPGAPLKPPRVLTCLAPGTYLF